MPTGVLLLLLLAAPPGSPGPDGGENLFRGPARCVLGYLEAVRLAGPRGPVLPRAARELAQSYRAARALTAPRALEHVDRDVARGVESSLAPWREAARGIVLESFSLLEVRRAPLGTAVVLVRERLRREGFSALGITSSEYLVARVGGEWKVVDRRMGARFRDSDIAERYAGWFDLPQVVVAEPPRGPDVAPRGSR